MAGEMFRIPGTGRLLGVLIVDEGDWTAGEGTAGIAFLTTGVVIFGPEGVVVTSLPFPLSRDGKSSGSSIWCVVGTGACDAITFDKPELTAKLLTSCFACMVVKSASLGVATRWTGVVGTDTFAKGVAALGI